MLKRSLIAVLVLAAGGCSKEDKPVSGSSGQVVEPTPAPAPAQPPVAPDPAAKPAEPAAQPAEPAARPAQPTVAAPAQQAPRAPTPDEIDRCTSLRVITAACGLSDDYEFGWVKAKPKTLSAAAARKLCSVAKTVNEEGMSAFPVKVLAPAQLAKVEAASKQDCKAVFKALDEVDPRGGAAGHDPSQ